MAKEIQTLEGWKKDSELTTLNNDLSEYINEPRISRSSPFYIQRTTKIELEKQPILDDYKKFTPVSKPRS